MSIGVCEPRTWPVAFSRMARLWIMSNVLPWWPQLFDSRTTSHSALPVGKFIPFVLLLGSKVEMLSHCKICAEG